MAACIAANEASAPTAAEGATEREPPILAGLHQQAGVSIVSVELSRAAPLLQPGAVAALCIAAVAASGEGTTQRAKLSPEDAAAAALAGYASDGVVSISPGFGSALFFADEGTAKPMGARGFVGELRYEVLCEAGGGAERAEGH